MLFANMCEGFIRSNDVEFWERFFFGFSSVSCVCGCTSLACHPVVHKACVTLVCLLLDTPFGRRSVGALPL